MKTTILYILGILALVATGIFILNNVGDSSTGNSVISDPSAESQRVIIGLKNGNYYPNTITVKSGIPVILSLDSTVSGCLRDFTIKDLGVRKYLQTSKDTLVFTPEKPGTYKFACSMGMGTGTLIVE